MVQLLKIGLIEDGTITKLWNLELYWYKIFDFKLINFIITLGIELIRNLPLLKT